MAADGDVDRFEDAFALPPMSSGSEKQVEWARRIRRVCLSQMHDISPAYFDELSRIRSPRRWIEEIGPLGTAREWIRVREAGIGDLRKRIRLKAEIYKQVNPGFDLPGFLEYMAGQSDNFVLKSRWKQIHQLNKGRINLSQWIESMGGNPSPAA